MGIDPKESGARGGKARAMNMTSEERREACRKAIAVRWNKSINRRMAQQHLEELHRIAARCGANPEVTSALLRLDAWAKKLA